ncbi:hypothetical protein RN001_013795 [Aquatica leii]|uniref:Uncharacterized protein n=1 Tax=Aquatica leii TaxID=1421715 RepID=A0AAN7NWQ4_9COLE|nr:hypothetical protein RN001_013795 [Aquatica leii]
MSKPKVSFSKSKPGPSGVSKTKKFQIPALSVPLKAPPVDPTLERLKKKVIRRNAPPGEDIKKIKEIIKQFNKETISVQEFVGLISPYTGDNGRDLKSVMDEDLASFRNMAKRIYDTMTQDVSDVLANEQIRITEYFNERYTLYMDKMMRTIDEIYRYVPNFDFELYYKDKNYLNKLFPVPNMSGDYRDPDEMEMHNRQEAYHRLEWMRSEGIRLNKENTQLQNRLRELKLLQKKALMESRKHEENAEQHRLEDLNESMEKSIIQNEQVTRLITDSKLTQKPRQTVPKRRPSARPTQPWSVKTAKALEREKEEEAVASAVSTISTTSVVSKTGAVKKKARPKIKKQPIVPRDVSPFHYSPIKTPPPGPSSERQASPFHYSPPRSPVESQVPTRTVRIESTTRIVDRAPPEQLPGRITGRRNLAPRDNWRGFQ